MSEDGLQWVAVVVVIVKDGRLLALRRAMTKDAAPGLWEAVSGRVRAGEEPRDAAAREALEESGLAVEIEPRPVDALLRELPAGS